MNTEKIDTVVIGGGQAGLAMGYYLARQGRNFVILDAHERVGDSWRKRWDSLRLFTPASFNNLPGMPFPTRRKGGSRTGLYFPTKDEMADYLEAYAARFELPLQLGVRVDELNHDGDRYQIIAGIRHIEANQVVVATGAYPNPRVPSFAGELAPEISQLHSVEYCNPSQIGEGPVLIVGAGNSGAEIALDLAPGHSTWLAGRNPGSIPGRFGSIGFRIGGILFFTVGRLLTVDTFLGWRLIQRAREFAGGHPVVRIKPDDLLKAGVRRVPRVMGIHHGQPVLEDGSTLDVATVIWATGFVRDYRWIHLPVFDARGEPIHHRGVVEAAPGLYFTGLPFQSSLLSGHVAGAGADAKYIVKQIASRARGLTFRMEEGLAS